MLKLGKIKEQQTCDFAARVSHTIQAVQVARPARLWLHSRDNDSFGRIIPVRATEPKKSESSHAFPHWPRSVIATGEQTSAARSFPLSKLLVHLEISLKESKHRNIRLFYRKFRENPVIFTGISLLASSF